MLTRQHHGRIAARSLARLTAHVRPADPIGASVGGAPPMELRPARIAVEFCQNSEGECHSWLYALSGGQRLGQAPDTSRAHDKFALVLEGESRLKNPALLERGTGPVCSSPSRGDQRRRVYQHISRSESQSRDWVRGCTRTLPLNKSYLIGWVCTHRWGLYSQGVTSAGWVWLGDSGPIAAP